MWGNWLELEYLPLELESVGQYARKIHMYLRGHQVRVQSLFISTSFDASSGKGDSRGLTMRHLMQASSRETSHHAQYMARAVLLSGTTLLDVIS